MGRTLALAFALAIALVAPLAAADHVFSHRVYVTGRVIDVDGRPIPDEPVDATFAGILGGGCLNGGNERTSETGDFSICRHTHAIPPGTSVTVIVAGANATAPIDQALRSASFLLRSNERRARSSIQGDQTFNTTFRVAGRSFALLNAPEDFENVMVNATPRSNVNVTVTLGNVSKEVKLDEFGNYVADLAIGSLPPGARATATAGNSTWSADASPVFRRANVDVVLAAPEVLGANRPGANVPMGGALLALAAIALTAAASRRR